MAGHSKWANIKHRKARQDASTWKSMDKGYKRNNCCSKRLVLILMTIPD